MYKLLIKLLLLPLLLLYGQHCMLSSPEYKPVKAILIESKEPTMSTNKHQRRGLNDAIHCHLNFENTSIVYMARLAHIAERANMLHRYIDLISHNLK